MISPEHKNDKIAADVMEELQGDPRVWEEDIRVMVKSGEVNLNGYTENLFSSRAATEAAWRVQGVEAVRNDLKVRVPHKDWKQDEQIAEAARKFLDWNVMIDAGDLGINVENGWVTLTGEVTTGITRQETEAIIMRMRGVKGLSNMIKVRPDAASNMGDRIKKTLIRNRYIHADHIRINASKGTIKITGEVETREQQEEILDIIWSVPGVQSVESRIHIRGIR